MEKQPNDNEGGHEKETTKPSREHGKNGSLTPKIYAASLSDYNAGTLHGKWIDATLPREEIDAEIQKMLNESPTPGAEEYGIFDFEGFGGWRPDEYEALNTVSAVAEGIIEHGRAFGYWASVVEDNDPELLTKFEEAYLGHFEKLADYGEELLDGTGLQQSIESATPKGLIPYVKIDVEALVRDMALGGDIIAVLGDGGVYVFSGTV